MPSTRIRLSELKDHGFQALVASFDQPRCFRMSRGIESGTTTNSLQEFLRQTTGKVGATIRTNDPWNRKSCKNLQQSFADSGNRSNRDSICNFNWSSKLTNLTRCTIFANSLIHSREPKV